jgi:hypothetical protein
MNLVEVPQGVGQLGQHGIAAAAVHVAGVNAFIRNSKACSHAVSLRPVHWRMYRLETELAGKSVRFGSPKNRRDCHSRI